MTSRIPFSSADHRRILALGNWMAGTSFFNAAMAGIFMLSSVIGLVALAANIRNPTLVFASVMLMVFCVAGAIALGVQSALLMRARSALRSVVATDDADAAHLANAFSSIRSFFAIDVVAGAFTIAAALLDIGILFAQRSA